jgi:hypothetical protein
MLYFPTIIGEHVANIYIVKIYQYGWFLGSRIISQGKTLLLFPSHNFTLPRMFYYHDDFLYFITTVNIVYTLMTSARDRARI